MHLHPPKQARSRRTLNRLVQAALELIGERGVEATGVHDIVERAGSSVGSFYARFDGKEDLLLYLQERLWSDAEERWREALESEAWGELDFEPLCRAVVRVLLDTYRTGARQRRVLEGRKGAEASEAARRFHTGLRRDLGELLLTQRPRMSHPEPARAVDVGLTVVVGAIRELDESPDPGGSLPFLDDDELVRELGRVLFGYLGGSATGGGSDRADFFEIWG